MVRRSIDRIFCLALLGVGACGGGTWNEPGAATTSHVTGPCDGAASLVPAGFPSLGGNGCGTHLVVHDPSLAPLELRGDLGAEPLALGRYDLRFEHPVGPLGRFGNASFRLHALTVGWEQTGESCAGIRVIAHDAETYGSDTGGSQQGPFAKITVVGRAGDEVWGTFSAQVCAITGSNESLGTLSFIYRCIYIGEGRFSARVDAVSHETPGMPPQTLACRKEPGV